MQSQLHAFTKSPIPLGRTFISQYQ